MVTVTVPLALSSVAFNTDPQLNAPVAIADIDGEFASTITEPKSPLTAPAEFPAASVTVPEYEDTDKSLLSVFPSATVYLKTNAADPVPL